MERTEQLEQQMYELRSERIFFSSQMGIAMEGYWHGVPLSQERMNGLRDQIAEIDLQLNPLQEEYESLFHHYYVRFSADVPDTLGRVSRQTYAPVMRSKVDYNIDTTKQKIDWENDKNAQKLHRDLSANLIDTYNNIRFEMIIKWN
ncbi:MAG TPA: hypothetical protein VNX01_01665 [Bacteroidia bacterium]|jgi:hypothetical protein|nr:hypothetical protein [Bacteroidia bacterium]